MSVTINGSNGVVFNDGSVQGTAATSGLVNRIINGNFMIDQRNSGASVTPTADNTYTLDRWAARLSASSKFSVQQSTTAPAGFVNSLKVTSLSAYTVGAGDFFNIQQAIEGLNVADLGWGTANAKTVTLSFQVYSSLTGTFGGSILNSSGNRSYPFTYSIPVANTWTSVSVTIAGDTGGTWATNNTTGIQIWFGLGVGSTYSGTAGAWAGATYFGATGATSVVGTSGATFYITGVDLRKGSTGATAQTYDWRPYGTELALCQRYYYQITGGGSSAFAAIGSGTFGTITAAQIVAPLPVSMRTSPTVNYSGTITADGGSGSSANITSMGTVYGGNSATWFVVNTSGVTVGRGCVLYTANASTNYMTFNSEL